jgi:hypothetical protein
MADVELSGIEEVHDLYRIDPSEFVEARAALVKQLRADKRTDEARAVVKLRKPTVPAWALDHVASDEPELIEAALAAGETLRAATAEVLEGDATNLRAATEAERAATAAVIDAAGAHLPSLTPEHRERMTATLRAAAADEAIRAQLRAGLLAADHEPPAMGFATARVQPTSTNPAAADKPKGAATARLAEPPAEEPARPKRKIRRVGTPSSAKRAPVDEVDAKRKAKELARLQAEQAKEAEAAERRRLEAERAAELKRQQADLDAAATKARATADRLDEQARKAEDAAARARAEADAAIAEATDAERAAAAGPPD